MSSTDLGNAIATARQCAKVAEGFRDLPPVCLDTVGNGAWRFRAGSHVAEAPNAIAAVDAVTAAIRASLRTKAEKVRADAADAVDKAAQVERLANGS